MVHHLAITALVHGYAELLDAGDLAAVARLFEHATWRSASTGEVRRGTSEVSEVYDKVRLYDGIPRTRHLITNLVIDIAPDTNSATASCSFTVLQGVVSGQALQVVLCGRYLDRFEKADGRWRFSDRLFVVDLVGDLRKHFG
jgi:hypothetical protein